MKESDTGDEASEYVTIQAGDQVLFKGKGLPPTIPQEADVAAEDEAAGTYEDDGETFTATGENLELGGESG